MKNIRLTVVIIVMMLGFVSVKEIASDADIVTVSAAQAAISTKSATLYEGGTLALSLGNATGEIKWSSSDKTVAKVDQTGTVTAVKAGSAKIKAKNQGKTYTCKITVKKAGLSKTSVSVAAGESYTLKVKGTSIKSCSSSDKKVAKVTKTGKITAVNKGSCTIRVKCANGKTYKCKVSVKVLDPAELYKRCSVSVVEINTDISTGTGFYIEDNVIVTNYHVIDGAAGISAYDYNNDSVNILKIIGYDSAIDIALLETEKAGVPLKRNSHGITIGEKTYVIGSSYGLTSTFTDGMVTADRIDGNEEYIQTNTAISSGNSGGPLLNEYGEVMGIVTFAIQDHDAVTQNLNFAIEISRTADIYTDSPMTLDEFCSMSENYNPVTPVLRYLEENGTRLEEGMGADAAVTHSLYDSFEQDGETLDFRIYYSEQYPDFVDFGLQSYGISFLLYPEDLSYKVYCTEIEIFDPTDPEAYYYVLAEFKAASFTSDRVRFLNWKVYDSDFSPVYDPVITSELKGLFYSGTNLMLTFAEKNFEEITYGRLSVTDIGFSDWDINKV